MRRGTRSPLDVNDFLLQPELAKTAVSYRAKQIVFSPGESADAVFYVQKGRVKLSIASNSGKEAVLALYSSGCFFGECCLAGRSFRATLASALNDCCLIRIAKDEMLDLLRQQPAFSEAFMAHLLSRLIRAEEDLVDRFFNSSEKRLARVLLVLAGSGEEAKPEQVVPRISQETLATMVGTTRSRVNFFLNKFRKLGYIEYAGDDYKGDLEIRPSLRSVIDDQLSERVSARESTVTQNA